MGSITEHRVLDENRGLSWSECVTIFASDVECCESVSVLGADIVGLPAVPILVHNLGHTGILSPLFLSLGRCL